MICISIVFLFNYLRLLLLLLWRRLRRVDLERELLLRLVPRLPEEEDDFDLVFLTAMYPPRCLRLRRPPPRWCPGTDLAKREGPLLKPDSPSANKSSSSDDVKL
jgi:hypothetical protein